MSVAASDLGRKAMATAQRGRQDVAGQAMGQEQPERAEAASPQLTSIHAGKHGIFLKGTDHETFWQW